MSHVQKMVDKFRLGRSLISSIIKQGQCFFQASLSNRNRVLSPCGQPFREHPCSARQLRKDCQSQLSNPFNPILLILTVISCFQTFPLHIKSFQRLSSVLSTWQAFCKILWNKYISEYSALTILVFILSALCHFHNIC